MSSSSEGAGSGAALLRRLRRYTVPTVLLALIGIIVVFPVFMLVLSSLLDSPPRPGEPFGSITLENYRAAVNGVIISAAINSVGISVLGSALAVLIGATLAWILARSDAPFKSVIALAGIVPLFISALVGALAYALIASPRTGYINLLFRDLGLPLTIDIYSFGGIVFVLGLFYAPYAFIFMSSALQLMNPELEEAGEVHGATRLSVARRVTFPLVKPALLGAGILTLDLTLENFPVPQVLGTPNGLETLPSVIFRMMMQTPPRPNEASAVGMSLLVVMIFLIYVQSRLLTGREYVTVSGKGFRPKLIPLGRWRWPALAFAVLYLFLAAVLPVFALLQSALRAHGFIPNFSALFDIQAFTLDAFGEVLHYGPFLQAFANSIIVAGGAAILGTAFHFVLSYYVNRTNMPWRSGIEYFAMAPAAVPALLIGMGFLWAWISLPIPIYGTLLILIIAYVARFMPQGYRSISSTIVQVHRDLEDAAIVAGASRPRAAWSILAPLIRPGVASTALLLFILSMRELSTSLFLFTTDTRVLSIVIYEQWESGRWQRVAVMSLFYSLLLLVVTLAGRRWIGLKEA